MHNLVYLHIYKLIKENIISFKEVISNINIMNLDQYKLKYIKLIIINNAKSFL